MYPNWTHRCAFVSIQPSIISFMVMEKDNWPPSAKKLCRGKKRSGWREIHRPISLISKIEIVRYKVELVELIILVEINLLSPKYTFFFLSSDKFSYSNVIEHKIPTHSNPINVK